MTNVKYSRELARYERLLMRARAVHEVATRIAEDLRSAEEGAACAQAAVRELGCVVNKLETRVSNYGGSS